MTLPVPSQRTWAVGDIVTAAEMNANVRDAVNFLANPPVFLGKQTVGQAIATSTNVNVTLDTEVVDTYSGHSTTTNTDRYTAQVAGYYLCIGSINYPTNATGRRANQFEVNGTVVQTAEVAVNPNAGTGDLNVALLFLNVGDWVGMVAFQSSGASLTLTTSSPTQSFMACLWVHA